MHEHLENMFSEIHTDLKSIDANREEILNLSRSIVRQCSETIRAVHRLEMDSAQTKLISLDEAIGALQSIRDTDIRSDGAVLNAYQEYIEAKLYYAFVSKQPFPLPSELSIIPILAYITGVIDTVGEIRRYCLDSLLRDNIEEAKRSMTFMDSIYDHLVTLDYPGGLIPGVRKKTDSIRGVVEKMRGELAFAFQRSKLEKQLSRVLKE